MILQLGDNWKNGKWHNVFKADNSISFEIKENCLLDDFCDYCGYTIVKQIDSSNICVTGPISFLGLKPDLILQITNTGDVFTVKYALATLPIICLNVTFKEKDTLLYIEHTLEGKNLIEQLVYTQFVNRFVYSGAVALKSFMDEL
jgi:hypothetical protein